ncbi:MAG TPA: DPP IV N-terminal domain-containing protein, partial [Phototrophicaceae bacterium]|nr:DPP IV N-terminal domain-containing protein [Phototrophicaceae bacterium]
MANSPQSRPKRLALALVAALCLTGALAFGAMSSTAAPAQQTQSTQDALNTQVWMEITETAAIPQLTEAYLRTQRNAYATLTAMPSPTPSGGGHGQILFFSNRDGYYHIYVMNPDGSNPHRLTNTSARDIDPVWSPNGQQIIFVSDRTTYDQLYVMNADGSDQERLTDEQANDGLPAWSPDGSQIAFVSDR